MQNGEVGNRRIDNFHTGAGSSNAILQRNPKRDHGCIVELLIAVLMPKLIIGVAVRIGKLCPWESPAQERSSLQKSRSRRARQSLWESRKRSSGYGDYGFFRENMRVFKQADRAHSGRMQQMVAVPRQFTDL